MTRKPNPIHPHLQLMINLHEAHPFMTAFVITAIEKYATQISHLTEADWPKDHIITFALWQALAHTAQGIVTK